MSNGGVQVAKEIGQVVLVVTVRIVVAKWKRVLLKLAMKQSVKIAAKIGFKIGVGIAKSVTTCTTISMSLNFNGTVEEIVKCNTRVGTPV